MQLTSRIALAALALGLTHAAAADGGGPRRFEETFDGDRMIARLKPGPGAARAAEGGRIPWETAGEAFSPDEIIIKLKPAAATAVYGAGSAGVSALGRLSPGLGAAGARFKPKKIKPAFPGARERIPALQSLASGARQPATALEFKLRKRMARAPKGAKVPDLQNVFTVKLDLPAGETLHEALAAYRSDPQVVYAQPSWINVPYAVPNDPDFSKQWALHNVGQPYPVGGGTATGAPDADVDAPEAWNSATGSDAVLVGVIDFGIDYNHPDLRDNMWRNPGEVGGLPGVDDDANGVADDIYGYDFSDNDSDPMDPNGHGTHVAGTIAARGDNGILITGMAWRAKLMAVKIFGNATDAVISQGIRYAAENGADVISNSWGPGMRRPSSPILEEALDYAVALGCLPVFAAGNQGDDLAYYSPNNKENVISVAATDSRDAAAWFSNRGPLVDVAAPGVDILSTIPGGGLASYSGTSMACPHVSGAIAVLLGHNPSLTHAQIRSLITGTGDPAPAGLTGSGKRLNLNHMVTQLLTGNFAPTAEAAGPYSVNYPATSVALAGSATDDGLPSGSTLTYMWSFVSGPGPLTFTNPASPNATAHVTQSGRYRVRLTVSDGVLDSYDEAFVDVSSTREIGSLALTGAALEVSGNFAYVAEGASIRKVSVSNPSAPAVVATFQNAGSDFVNLSLEGSILFAADKTGKLFAINTPTMTTLGNVAISAIEDVHVKGNYAYVAAGLQGLKVYDVANTSAMALAGSLNQWAGARDLKKISSSGEWTCAGGPLGTVLVHTADLAQLRKYYDVSPPWDDIVRAKDIRFSGPNLYVSDGTVFIYRVEGQLVSGQSWVEEMNGTEQIALAGNNVLYVELAARGISLFDVHDQFNPEFLETFGFTTGIREMEAGAGLIYALTDGGFKVFQTFIPNIAPYVGIFPSATASLSAGLVLDGRVDDDGLPGGPLAYNWTLMSGPGTATFANAAAEATHVLFSAPGDYVARITANDGEKSSSVDVSIQVPRYVELQASRTTNGSGFNHNNLLVLKGNDLFINHIDGFEIMDVTNRLAPVRLGQHLIPNLVDAYEDFAVEGNYLYEVGDDGFTIFDVTNKAAPTLVSRIDDVNGNPQIFTSVAVQGNYAYAAYVYNGSGGGGVYVIDITNKAAPQRLGSFTAEICLAMDVQGDYLYAASNEGFRIIDVSDKNSPQVIATLPLGNFNQLRVHGGYAYMTTVNVLRIVDVTNKTGAFVAGSHIYDVNSVGSHEFCHVKGNYLFVGGNSKGLGLSIWNVTDKANPVMVDEYSSIWWTVPFYDAKGDFFLQNGTLLETMGAPGLPNTAPYVYAGDDKDVFQTADLEGVASDDGFPATGVLTTTWTKVSGPGTVTFGNASQPRTSATFSAQGEYVLRLTAGDGAFTRTADVRLTATLPGFQQDAGADGVVSMEVESFHANVSQGGKTWSLKTQAGSSGTALQALTNTGANVNTGYVTGAPRLDFRVNFVKTGTHYIWMRGWGPTTSDDSYHAGLDNQAIATSDRIGNFTNSWSWRKADLDAGQANFSVPSIGQHTVNVWMREDGFIVDKIVVTSSATYTPTGTGPAESPQTGVPPPVFHAITVSSGPNGSVSPCCNVQVLSGNSQAFTITPNAGHVVDRVLVDGVDAGPVMTYTFTNVQAPHALQASFKAAPPQSAKLSVIGATASAHDGNVPANAIDGSLSTRWSASGNPQWIRLDLGSVKAVDFVKLAFYSGNARQSFFDAEGSTDGTNFTPIRTGCVSSGTSLALESFELNNTSVRYVRIMGHGNSVNLWNSYTEVEVWGSDEAPPVFHTITASAGVNGSISPSGAVQVQQGSSQTFTIAPNSGFVIDRVEVDGVSQGAIASYTFTNVTAAHAIQAFFAPAPPVPAKLTVVSATASAHDGNVPANAIDGSLATRWSASGNPQWIRLDLGSAKTVTSVKVAFFKGNERQSFFDVEVSNDGTNFTVIRAGCVSSGTSTALETFDITNTQARYVRIMGHGNSVNLWNSYTETEAWGF